MAKEWWEDAPLAEESTSDAGDWWKDAPLADAKPKDRTFGEAAGDGFKSFGASVNNTLKTLTDLAGANNPASEFLGENAKTWQDDYSPEYKAELRKQAGEKAALGDDPSYAARAGLMARQTIRNPVEGVGELAGNIAPMLIGGVAGLGTKGIAALSAAMGAGAVKGGIAETVENAPDKDLMPDPLYAEMRNSGMSEKDAKAALSEQRASYGDAYGKILLGAGIGAAVGRFGSVENAIASMGKKVATQAPTGLMKSVGTGVAKEVATEIPQEMTETYLGNKGAADQGAKIAPDQGVIEAGVKAGILSAVGGGLAGASGRGGSLDEAPPAAESAPDPIVPPATILAAPSVDAAVEQFINETSAPSNIAAEPRGLMSSGAIDAGQQFKDLGITAPADDLAMQRVQSEREGAAASQARDQRLQDAGQAWQDLGVTNPSDDLQAQRMGLRENQDVSANPDLQQLPTGSTGRGGAEPGIGLEAALGRDAPTERAVGGGLPGAVPVGEPVAPADRGNADAVEPAKTWFGRKGDGYVTEGDAVMALPSRQKIEPDLNWQVEQMPSGKFRLAGYAAVAQNANSEKSRRNPVEIPEIANSETGNTGNLTEYDRELAGITPELPRNYPGITPELSNSQNKPDNTPSFDFTKNESGTVLVHGDPAAIRAAGINGVIKFDDGKPAGILVSVKSAPDVIAQLEAARVQNNPTNPSNIEAAPVEARAETPEVDGRAPGQAADSAAGSGAVQAVGQKQPWEMTRKEWESERDKIRPDTVQSNLTKASGSQAVGRAQALQDILYGVTDEASSRLKAAQKGEIELSEAELEDITNRLNTRVSHSDVVAKAISEGKPVPAEALADYPDLLPQGTPNAQASQAVAPAAQQQAAPAADPRLIPVSQSAPKPIDPRLIPKSTRAIDPEHLGADNTPLFQGGKPFKTRIEATAARKNQPMMRVIKSGKGFALAPKTEKQLAAQAAAAKRLATPRAGKKGVPIAAHEAIATSGGLAPALRAELGIEGNIKIGNRYLFAGDGKGLTLERATELLVQDGFVKEGASHTEVIALIKRSLTNPQYTPEGFERMAEAEASTRFEDHLAAQQESAQNDDPFALDESDLADVAGYSDADESIRAEVNALMEQAEAEGIDTDTIREEAHEDTKNGTDRDYLEAQRARAKSAIAGRAGSGIAQADQRQDSEQGRQDAERAGGDDSGEVTGAQSGEGLTAPTRADVLAQQADLEAEKKRREDGGDKPIAAKPFTADQVDLFNPQASIFDAPADPIATAVQAMADAVKGLQTALAPKQEAAQPAAKPEDDAGNVAMFSRSSGDGKSSVLSKNGKFQSWPKFNTWTRQEYRDVVSLLPEDYRSDPHRREPIATEDWDTLAAAVLPELDALNKIIKLGTFRLDSLGNILVDQRKSGHYAVIEGAIPIADKYGLGIYVTGVRTDSIAYFRDAGFVSELGLGAILQRAAGTSQPPMPNPNNNYGHPAYGTIMSYKPRGFAKPLFSLGDGESGAQSNTFPTDEANREKTDKLQAVLDKQGHDFTVTPVSVPVDAAGNAGERTSGSGPKNNFALAEFIAKIFGKEIVWVTVDGPSSFNGVVVPGGALSNQIFINANADHPAHVVLGHELTHHMESDAPGVYKALVKSLDGLLKNHEGYAKLYKIKGAAPETIVKEMIGDLMGDNFDKREFWNRVSQESDGLHFKMIANSVMKWLTNLLTKLKLRGLGSHRFVTDVQEARDILAKAVADYAKTKGVPALLNDGSVAPVFSGTNEPVTNPDDVVGNQGGRSADDNSPGVVYKDNLPPEPDGFKRLYHGGSGDTEYFSGKDFQSVPGDGVFDGFFAATDPSNAWGAHGSGHDYFADIAEDKILTDYALNYEIPHDESLAALKKAMRWLGEDDVDIAWKAVIEDRSHKVDDDDLQRIFREPSTGEASWAAQRVRGQVARLLGYEAVEMDDEHGTSYLIVPGVKITRALPPNEPTAPDSGGAQFSRSVITGQTLPQTWQAPDATKLDDFIYSMQDKHVDTKRITQAVRAAIGNIADNINPYLQEELYHGRAAMATKEFLEQQVRPLLTDLQARGIDMSDFEEYLHNRHAERRNVQVAKVNPNMPDGGSGINTADARAYLAGLTPAKQRAYQALAARVDQINRDTRALLVSSGLEKQEMIDAWQAAYGDEYVPLMREEMDNGMGIGQGFSVRGGSSKRAMGSDKPVSNIIANIALQREKAITRSEKQRIGHALYGMVLSAPNDDFWFAVDPKLQQNPAQVIATSLQLISLGMNPADADSIAREPKTRYINPQTGLVEERINPALRSADNVLAVRIDGEDKFVFFNAKDERAMRMAKALKNLDADQLGSVMGTVAKMTRYFSAINTQYNPIFGVTNITRDVQTAMLNLESTALKGHKADVMKHILPALRGIYIDLRDHRAGKQPTSAYAAIFEEFQREGGATGYRDMYANAQERADAIKDELADINAGKLKQLGKGVMGWLSDYNESMENAVRVSAYKVGIEQGLTKQQAASLAKNLTVNFNRKGQVALQAGALYAFFNASVQGTARIAETLFEGGKLSAVGKKIITGGLLLGSMQALLLAAAGFDDEEPPDFVRERNLVIPIGDKKYITIPMPLGFHVLPNIARIPTEWVMGGFRNTPKRIGQMVGLFADAFNPIGSAGLSLQTLTPTIIDPLAALSENKDFTGRPIAKKDFDPMHPTAGHTRAKDSATPWAKFISQAVNFATGGTDYKPGLASPTPDQIDYLIGQVTGGVGREVGKASQVISGGVSGEDVPLYKIPLVGRFVGTTEGQAAEAGRFYDNLRSIGEHKVELDGLRHDSKGAEAAAYFRENREAMLVPMATKLQNDVSKLNKLKRELLSKDASPERIKLIDMQITQKMKMLNDRVRSLREKEPA